jgi:hypothetical protein
MGALDGGMAGDQLPGAVAVAEAAPGSDDMDAPPEQRVLEVEGVKPGAASRPGVAVDEFQDQSTHPRDVDEIVDCDAAGHRITAERTTGHGRLLAARGTTPRIVPEPQLGRVRHHCGRVLGQRTSVRVIA